VCPPLKLHSRLKRHPDSGYRFGHGTKWVAVTGCGHKVPAYTPSAGAVSFPGSVRSARLLLSAIHPPPFAGWGIFFVMPPNGTKPCARGDLTKPDIATRLRT
jgi:hypothetical protein